MQHFTLNYTLKQVSPTPSTLHMLMYFICTGFLSSSCLLTSLLRKQYLKPTDYSVDCTVKPCTFIITEPYSKITPRTHPAKDKLAFWVHCLWGKNYQTYLWKQPKHQLVDAYIIQMRNYFPMLMKSLSVASKAQ